MLSLSVTTGYAIKALMCLESGDCVPQHVRDIAQCAGVPRAYLAKIFSALSREGLVQTKRGYRGGISLTRRPEDISLLQIVEAVDGDDLARACVFLMENYSEEQFINIGYGSDVSIRELAETIKRVVGFGGRIIWDTSKPDGAPRKLMDSSRLFALGWKPTVDLESGIRRAYEDFLKRFGKP